MTTIPESHRDLLTTDVALLATVGRDGYPQVTALWFLDELSSRCTPTKSMS